MSIGILGAIRSIDINGRIQIPADMRVRLGLKENTELNVYVADGKIIIEPIRDVLKGNCNICGTELFDLPIGTALETVICERCVKRWKLNEKRD